MRFTKGIPDEAYKGTPDEAYKGDPDEATILDKKQPRRNKECEEERTTVGGY